MAYWSRVPTSLLELNAAEECASIDAVAPYHKRRPALLTAFGLGQSLGFVLLDCLEGSSSIVVSALDAKRESRRSVPPGRFESAPMTVPGLMDLNAQTEFLARAKSEVWSSMCSSM